MAKDPQPPVTIWTIGHSSHPLAHFVALLQAYDIQVVVDVRSRPYSRFASQFNRPALDAVLPVHNIRYVFMGKELGGKLKEAAYYLPDGSLDPKRFTARPEFQQGLERLLAKASRSRVCLMCSEGDPLKCHRTLLLAPELALRGVRVLHILPDGSVLDHQEVQQPQKPQQMRLF